MGIYASPVPVYALSPWSPRIHARGHNVTSIPSEVRQHLTARLGWAELDLVHSQLACNASLWSLQPVLERLRDPEYHFWDDLIRHVGGDPVTLRAKGDYDRLKTVLKRPVQGVSFMMGPKRVRRLGARPRGTDVAKFEGVVREVLGRSAAEVGDALLTHPVIQAMRSGSYRQKWWIEKRGGLRDAFGRRIPLAEPLKLPQLLAYGTQALELWLLMPAVEIAIAEAQKREAEFQILVWQRDGFTIKARDPSRLRTHVVRLQQAIAERAEQAGIPTRLDLKVGPGC